MSFSWLPGLLIGKDSARKRNQTQKWKFPYDELTSNFSFTCPAAGTLEYLITYLVERTDETPSDVSTPMDIYREAIEKNREEPHE